MQGHCDQSRRGGRGRTDNAFVSLSSHQPAQIQLDPKALCEPARDQAERLSEILLFAPSLAPRPSRFRRSMPSLDSRPRVKLLLWPFVLENDLLRRCDKIRGIDLWQNLPVAHRLH